MSGVSLTDLLLALGGYEGVKWLITFWVHRKQEKRMKKNEADQSEVATEKAVRDMYEETLTEMRKEYIERINELHQANTELNKQNLELLKAGARKDDIIADKNAKIRELQEIRNQDTKTIGKLEGDVQYLDCWKCYREFGKGENDCDRRKPEQVPPLKFKLRKGLNDDAG